MTFTVDTVAKKLGLLLKFSKKLPKVKNHPTGEKSPNLVTLVAARVAFCDNVSRICHRICLELRISRKQHRKVSLQYAENKISK
jgi:hypothetical protein